MFGRLRRSLPGQAARPKNALRTRRSSRSTCASGSSKGFSPPRGIVVDPFLGSGSTIEACLQWGRYSVGFEIKKDYCAVASERIRGALEQEGLPF
jgi:hypothetical protein